MIYYDSEGVKWCWPVIDLFFHNFNPFFQKNVLVPIRLAISMSKQNWVPNKLSIFGGY
jgi:hypothetical protein